MGRQQQLSWLIGLVLIVTVGARGILPYESPDCLGDYAPGVVLSKFHNSASIMEHYTGLNILATDTIPGIDVAILHVAIGQECAVRETLRHDSRVAFAELDYAVHATETRFLEKTRVLVPNDPEWTQQWGPAKIGAPAAWGVTTGTPDITIAVLDTGIQQSHRDLADNLWANPGEIPGNGIDDDGNGKIDDLWGWHFYHEWAWDGEKYTYLPRENNVVTDDNGHGTHIAGIAGAEINNDVGIAGMAGRGRLMAIKIMNQNGYGWYSDMAKGIVYAVDNGAKIINLSAGGRPSSQVLQEAVDYAHARDVLVIAAAGNKDPIDGYDAVLYPAACEQVLAVAATDQSDNRPSFSNHGPQVDVAAPGKDIYSTWYRGNYFSQSGTSMATPHVSGLAALIWSARPDLAVEQVTGIITSTAKDTNGGTLLLSGWDEYLGWGRIEAGQALSATVRAGNLHLTASHLQLTVGEATTITATVPFTTVNTGPFTFTASNGTVSPALTTLTDGVATTTLVAGSIAGMTIVTGTNTMLTGALFLRLIPGPMVSTTLTPATREVSFGEAVTVTAAASDSLGNPAIDGTFIHWATNRGSVLPNRSLFYGGVSRATFIASDTYGSAIISASLESGIIATTTLDISHPYHYYLSIISRNN